eukprot:GHVN01093894.1.p1 GENE.GHVN01093894.1~~GHVN01093894.1.p1  ORF type:complete len:194 (+),score=17.60 GHVN01093894.1:659-1240(+)
MLSRFLYAGFLLGLFVIRAAAQPDESVAVFRDDQQLIRGRGRDPPAGEAEGEALPSLALRAGEDRPLGNNLFEGERRSSDMERERQRDRESNRDRRVREGSSGSLGAGSGLRPRLRSEGSPARNPFEGAGELGSRRNRENLQQSNFEISRKERRQEDHVLVGQGSGEVEETETAEERLQSFEEEVMRLNDMLP